MLGIQTPSQPKKASPSGAPDQIPDGGKPFYMMVTCRWQHAAQKSAQSSLIQVGIIGTIDTGLMLACNRTLFGDGLRSR